MNKEPAEKEDYYFDENNNLVFTAKYLLNRETCCGNGCRHCPYNYINVPLPVKDTGNEADQKFLNKR
jgi:Family of unknown function (DUF5522)